MGKRKLGKTTRIKVYNSEVVFRFQNPDIDEWKRDLDHFSEKFEDFSEVFDAFGGYMLGSIQRNFQAEGRPRRWVPLKEATIKQRIRLGYGAGPILQRTGALKSGFYFESTKRTFRMGNRRKYFVYHQLGAPKTNLPKRPMLVLQDRDKAEFTRLARKYLTWSAR